MAFSKASWLARASSLKSRQACKSGYLWALSRSPCVCAPNIYSPASSVGTRHSVPANSIAGNPCFFSMALKRLSGISAHGTIRYVFPLEGMVLPQISVVSPIPASSNLKSRFLDAPSERIFSSPVSSSPCLNALSLARTPGTRSAGTVNTWSLIFWNSAMLCVVSLCSPGQPGS